jgi:hypothetical protein
MAPTICESASSLLMCLDEIYSPLLKVLSLKKGLKGIRTVVKAWLIPVVHQKYKYDSGIIHLHFRFDDAYIADKWARG